MRSFGRSTVSEFLGDQIVFRNLVPYDPRLPGLPDLREKLGLPQGFIPRKSTPEYGKVLAEMVRAAQDFRLPGKPLKRLIYIGDTRMNDGQAFLNICKASGWEGIIFIGADRPGPLKVEIEQVNSEAMFVATRWNALEKFGSYLHERDFPIDEQTAVLFDLDKTILGARGRNDGAIDAKRLEAADDTLSNALGIEYNPEVFRDAYDTFNQVEFHSFTADNQDYLVYICLIVSSGLITQSDLIQNIRSKDSPDFMDFLSYVNERVKQLPSKVREIHQNVSDRVKSGDPTPFKTFRYNEFKRTVQHMGHLPDDAPIEQILAEEIVITGEIRDFAKRWKAQGALPFGLSDKPDEAVLPPEDMKSQNIRPIHQTVTHVIGEA